MVLLSAPRLVTAQPGAGPSIKLTWSDTSTGETGFYVERAPLNGTFARIATVPAGSTTYNDTTGLASNTTYTYRIQAFNGGGVSSFSNTLNATTLAPPAAPSDLVATTLSSTSIKLTWTVNSTTETSFEVWRKTDVGTFTLVKTVAAADQQLHRHRTDPQHRLYVRGAGDWTGRSLCLLHPGGGKHRARELTARTGNEDGEACRFPVPFLPRFTSPARARISPQPDGWDCCGTKPTSNTICCSVAPSQGSAVAGIDGGAVLAGPYLALAFHGRAQDFPAGLEHQGGMGA